MKKVALLWFRYDLRLSDNDALQWAIDQGYEILPYYHLSQHEQEWEIGGATRWWLHHALDDLAAQIKQLGGTLHLASSELPTDQALLKTIADHEVEAVLWNRSYEPAHVKRDATIKAHLKEQGLHVQSFNSTILYEPTTTFNKSGKPYRVFTPFWKALVSREIAKVESTPEAASWYGGKQESAPLQSYALLPDIKWDGGFYEMWDPTRAGALARVKTFSPKNAVHYLETRDRPDLDGTSLMSPYLHFGQIGPRELVHTLRSANQPTIESGIVRQLYWREFAHHLLYHFPQTTTQPLYEKYANFPWDENPALLAAWQKGQTGFPIVDAGMRQLWATGWMHNRVRMIVGSFLVKHLLQPWQEGADWFWDTLVDASLPNNTMGWQWIAGSGADGAPYFRVFNPITQGKKFDETGEYVRKWCPELKDVPLKYLHAPFEAPPLELLSAGVTLGKEYPNPIISHADGRAKALDAFAKFKASQES